MNEMPYTLFCLLFLPSSGISSLPYRPRIARESFLNNKKTGTSLGPDLSDLLETGGTLTISYESLPIVSTRSLAESYAPCIVSYELIINVT